MRSETHKLIGGWLLCVLIHVAMAWPNIDTTVDDAWISARYAANFVDGYGLVFNRGELPVEGYTNLLWVFFLAGGRMIGANMHGWMTWGGLTFGVLGLGFATALAGQLIGERSWRALLAPLLMALSPHYAVVVTNGLESALFIAGLLAACWATLTATGAWRYAAGVTIVLLGLTRPEGMVVGGFLVGYDVWRHRDRLRSPESWIVASVASAGCLSALGWRVLTYGDLVPNTFHAKGSLALGELLTANLKYLHLDGVYWYAVAAVFAVLALLPRVRAERILLAIIGAGLLVIAFRVTLWMPGGRLLMPPFTLGTCLAAALFGDRGGWRNGIAASLVVASVACLGLPVHGHTRIYDWAYSVLGNNAAAQAAHHLERHAPEGAWLAIRDAGVVAYWMGTDVRVAELHQRALSLPHPEGRDTDLQALPRNPTFLVLTQQDLEFEGVRYYGDRFVFDRLEERYVYLGRVYQHYRRFYDFYSRADARIPALPKHLVVNRKGPDPHSGS